MGVRGIKKCCVVLMIIQIWSWVYATSRPLVPNQDSLNQGTISPQAVQHNYMRPIFIPKEIKNEVRREKEERETIRKSKRIGSKPPSCEKKCYGCEPCEAIQVPTSSSSSSLHHLSIHNFANYQPEGWRCLCSP